MTPGPESTLWYKKWWIWGLVLTVLALLPILSKPAPELPIIGQVPAYSLTREDGATFGSEQLKGKVYVASFIFSRCPSVCPRMLQALETFQGSVASLLPDVALVTFTVDPDYDTPSVLRQTAQSYHARPELWAFATSPDKAALLKLYGEGFKVGVTEVGPATDLFAVAHSEKAVLVDQKGQIRGFYALDPQGVALMGTHMAQLIGEAR